jgi:hypothetical protein
MLDRDKRSSLFDPLISYKGKYLHNMGPRGQFHKHFYGPSKIRGIVHHMHASMQRFQNARAYFAAAISYMCKVGMKLTTVACTIKVLHFSFECNLGM